jgi:hypothetical protein
MNGESRLEETAHRRLQLDEVATTLDGETVRYREIMILMKKEEKRKK